MVIAGEDRPGKADRGRTVWDEIFYASWPEIPNWSRTNCLWYLLNFLLPLKASPNNAGKPALSPLNRAQYNLP